MIPFFRKKEKDVHELEGVRIRNTRSSSHSEELEDEKVEEMEDNGVGLLVQFTPVATYLYINKEGFNYSDDLNGYFELRDLDGNAIDVFGNVISTRIDHIDELPSFINRYRLEHPTIPLIKIEVEHYEER